MKRIPRYLRGIIDFKLIHSGKDEKKVLAVYADFDFANDMNEKSISGYVFNSFGNTISWSTI
jgi:hypothetical protein